jgi:hypothetical protein
MQAGIYKHYKGGYYQVLGIAQHTETKVNMVVYISLGATQPGPRMRVRPLTGDEGFNTAVLIDGLPRNRFSYIGCEVC